MRTRARKCMIIGTALLLGGLVYAWICSIVGGGIPCVFYSVTGWQCPGCGVSRMCLALLRLDVAGAFEANPMILLLSPFLLVLGVRLIARYIRVGSLQPTRWETVGIWIAIVTLFVFAVWRNL